MHTRPPDVCGVCAGVDPPREAAGRRPREGARRIAVEGLVARRRTRRDPQGVHLQGLQSGSACFCTCLLY